MTPYLTTAAHNITHERVLSTCAKKKAALGVVLYSRQSKWIWMPAGEEAWKISFPPNDKQNIRDSAATSENCPLQSAEHFTVKLGSQASKQHQIQENNNKI